MGVSIRNYENEKKVLKSKIKVITSKIEAKNNDILMQKNCKKKSKIKTKK